MVKLGVDALDHLDLLGESLGSGGSNMLDEVWRVEAFDMVDVLDDMLLIGRKEIELVVEDVVHALEAVAHADRPNHRRGHDAELLLDFIEEVEGV